MALRYTLVPMEWLTKRNNQTHSDTASQMSKPPLPTIVDEYQSTPHEADESSVEEDEYDAIVNMMPRQMRQKAKLLAHYTKNRISLTENGRVVYGDQSIGSHLHDLIRFFVSSPTLRVPRPVDAVKFGITLKRIGVPRAALGRDLTLIRDAQDTRAVPNPNPKKRSRNGSQLHWKAL